MEIRKIFEAESFMNGHGVEARKFYQNENMMMVHLDLKPGDVIAKHLDVIKDPTIDSFISPQQSTIVSLLTHIRQGDVVKVHSLRKGSSEALEAIVHGNKKTSRVIGKKVAEIKLPKGAIIGAIVRGDEVIINQDDIVIQSRDHVIIFLAYKSLILEIESLFQLEK